MLFSGMLTLIKPKNPLMKKLIFLTLLFYCLTSLHAQVKMIIPFEPQIFKGENKTSIVYEVHLKDSLNNRIEIEEFSVKSNNSLLLNNSEFIKYDFKSDTNRFLKNIWIDIDTFPVVLLNTLKCNINGSEYQIEKEITINDKDLLIVRFPFTEGIWFAGGGPSDSSFHRVFSQKVQSKYNADLDGFILGYCNQRFAIDWLGVNEKYQFCKSDGRTKEDFYGYGREVVAVANGKVIWAKDGIPDCIPPEYSDTLYKAETALGNSILLDIGNDIVVFYAHLKLNSIKVNVGDKVNAGDIIGQVGNSGPSTGPHLHFDIRKKIHNPFMEGLNRFYSQSISYTFDKYELIGKGIVGESGTIFDKVIKDEKFINRKLPSSDEIIRIQ